MFTTWLMVAVGIFKQIESFNRF